MLKEHNEIRDDDNQIRLLALLNDLKAVRSRGASRRTLLVIYRGLALLQAYDISVKSPVEVEWMGTARLDLLAERHSFDRVLALEETALARIYDHATGESGLPDDHLKRAGALYRGLVSEWRRTVFTYPAGPRRLPAITDRAVRKAVRLLIPGDSALLLVVARGGRPWASLVLLFRGDELRLVTSLDALGRGEIRLDDCLLDEVTRTLENEFGGRARVVVMDREALYRVVASRCPAASALWAVNTGNLRLVNIPWRLDLLALAITSLAGARSTLRSRVKQEGSSRGSDP